MRGQEKLIAKVTGFRSPMQGVYICANRSTIGWNCPDAMWLLPHPGTTVEADFTIHLLLRFS